MAIATTKLSVLALYYKIFAKPLFRTVVLYTIIFVCAWLVAMEVTLGLGCRPIQGWWGEIAPAECVNKVAFTYFTNITNLVTDIWIFSLPIPILLSLQMQKNRRISLMFLFSFGLATCAISAARLQFVVGVGSDDFTCKTSTCLAEHFLAPVTDSILLRRDQRLTWYLVSMGAVRRDSLRQSAHRIPSHAGHCPYRHRLHGSITEPKRKHSTLQEALQRRIWTRLGANSQ
jgi:hypothetical protein